LSMDVEFELADAATNGQKRSRRRLGNWMNAQAIIVVSRAGLAS